MPKQKTAIKDHPGPRTSSSARPAAVATIERLGQSIAITPPCEAIRREVATAQHVAAVHEARGFLTVP